MREKAWRIRSHSLRILWGLLMIVVFANGEVHSAGVTQSRSGAPPRVSQSSPSNNPSGRRATLPQRRGSNMQAAPLPGSVAPNRVAPNRAAPNRVAGGTTAPRTQDTRSPSTSPATNFPYSVTTINPRTPIRSMPSDDGYPTAFVGPQTELQVWRHDPDGWLAIRPPAGSFSLVDAKHLKATNDPDVFVVQTDRAQTWVGTQVDEDHTPVSQVRLKLNERVAVISSLIIEEQDGAQTWYQIEPPAGEFRWVHQDDLRQGGRAYQAPSPNAMANRPQAPANAPMSGYMPPLNSATSTAHSPNGEELPALELEPGFDQGPGNVPSQPGGTSPEASQWRAAQQTTPVLGYVEPQPWQNTGPGGFPTHPAGHSTNPGSNSANGSLVQPLTEQSGMGRGSPDNPSLVRGANHDNPSTVRGATPGDMWDAAVNQLRQDPIANAVANASHQSFEQPPKMEPPTINSPAPATLPDPQWATMDWNQKLAWVQTRLNQDSALPTQQWNLLPLLEHCRALWYAAPSTVQQEAAASLGRRIEELMQWQYTRGNANDLSAANPNDPWAGQRWASAGSFIGSGVAAPPANSAASGALSNNGFTPSAASAPNGPAPSPPANTAYDAVGYLKELLVARGQRSNEYVLQDNNGRSICHISAQPGVNLNTFLDQKVGVIGIKGINGKLNLPHVSVERIYRVP